MRNPNWRARKPDVFEPALASRPSGPRQGDSKVALVKQGVRGALRAKNLRLLLDAAPAPEDLALLAEVPRERLQNMASGALCSDETAYHLEQQLELPSGWLDRVNSAVPARYLELLAHPPLLDEEDSGPAGAAEPALPPTLQPAQVPLPLVSPDAPAAPANSPAYRPAHSPANARRAALQAVVGSPAPVHDAQPATISVPQPAAVKPASPSSSKQASRTAKATPAAQAKKPPKAPVKTPPKAPVKALAKAPPKTSAEKPVENQPEKKAGNGAKKQSLTAPSTPALTASIPPAPHRALPQPLPHAEPAAAPAKRPAAEGSSAAAAAPRQASPKTPKVPKVPVVRAATPPLPDSLSPKKEEAAMTSPTELHRANLNVLLSGKGAKSALARLLGLSPASVTGMLNGAKPLDQALLETVSRVAKLGEGWFDSARTPDDISADTQALLSPLVRGSVAPAPATAAPAAPAYPSGGSAKGAAATGTPHPPATPAHAATSEAALADKPSTWPASGSKVARLRGMAEQDSAAGGAVKGGARAPGQPAPHEPPPPHRTPEAQRGDVPPEVHAVLVDKALPPIAEALIRTLAHKASTGALSEDQAFELLGSVRALP